VGIDRAPVNMDMRRTFQRSGTFAAVNNEQRNIDLAKRKKYLREAQTNFLINCALLILFGILSKEKEKLGNCELDFEKFFALAAIISGLQVIRSFCITCIVRGSSNRD
jgi:hypothetical protein